jgi:hypothetical protein
MNRMLIFILRGWFRFCLSPCFVDFYYSSNSLVDKLLFLVYRSSCTVLLELLYLLLFGGKQKWTDLFSAIDQSHRGEIFERAVCFFKSRMGFQFQSSNESWWCGCVVSIQSSSVRGNQNYFCWVGGTVSRVTCNLVEHKKFLFTKSLVVFFPKYLFVCSSLTNLVDRPTNQQPFNQPAD